RLADRHELLDRYAIECRVFRHSIVPGRCRNQIRAPSPRSEFAHCPHLLPIFIASTPANASIPLILTCFHSIVRPADGGDVPALLEYKTRSVVLTGASRRDVRTIWPAPRQRCMCIKKEQNAMTSTRRNDSGFS